MEAIQARADGVSMSTRLPDGKEATFSFDRVFPAGTAQSAIFQEVAELVQSALDGYQVHPWRWLSIPLSTRTQDLT